MKPTLLVALAFVSLAAGCASGGAPGACEGVNWYQQGYMDGRRTWYSRLDEHEARCASSGARVDAVQYQRGWANGRFDYEHRPSGP